MSYAHLEPDPHRPELVVLDVNETLSDLSSMTAAFADIAAASLRVRLAAAGAPDPQAGAQHVMERFMSLDPHPDVVPGLQALSEAGCRIVTLSNGSAAVARALLENSAAGAVIEDYLTVADAGAWKPAGSAYGHALSVTAVPAERAMLVAVHPWDIEGAHRAGLRTAWINRSGADYPAHLAAADVEVSSLVELGSMFSR